MAGGARCARAARAAAAGARPARLAGARAARRRRPRVAPRGSRGALAATADAHARAAAPSPWPGVRRVRRRPRAGGRSRWCSCPAWPNACFRSGLREDALLLDERRDQLNAPLPKQKQRADEERLQLRLAVGAASARAYLSWPRVELQESRQRVPSFYVLDIARAIEGRIPAYATVRDRAFAAGGATLAWPAPEHPERAIDEFEHDLSMLYQLLREQDRARAKGRGRYLYELSPHLQRSLTGRWARWQKRWHPADGLIRTTPATAPALGRQRLGVRPFSLSALQRFADCPYQFQLSAIFRLAPLEEPAPLQRLDPLTRGSLFHQIQAEFFRALEKNGLLPITERRVDAARKMLDWAIGRCRSRRRTIWRRRSIGSGTTSSRRSPAICGRGSRGSSTTANSGARTLRVCVWPARRSQSRSALGRRTGRRRRSIPHSRLDRSRRAPPRRDSAARHRPQDGQEPYNDGHDGGWRTCAAADPVRHGARGA